MIAKALKQILFLCVIFTLLGAPVLNAAGIKPATRQIPRRGPLTEREMGWARTAWSYFQNNVNPATGLAGAQPNYSLSPCGTFPHTWQRSFQPMSWA